MTEEKCNICDDALHAAILRGERPAVAQFTNCPVCASRARVRTFRIGYDLHVVPRLPGGERRALAVSAVSWVRKRLAADFREVVNSALFGNYGPNTVRSDLRDLKEFADASFDYVDAMNVLDYVVEQERVFRSVHRVLRRGGLFFFFIFETRLSAGDEAPAIRRMRKNLLFPEQYPGGYEMPSVQTGRRWILRELAAAGFEAGEHVFTDLHNQEVCTWFLGRKPSS